MTLSLNNRLRDILNEEGLSIRELSRQLDVIAKQHNPDAKIHFESVRKLVNNEMTQIPLDLMFVLTQRFDLTLDDIFQVSTHADK